MYLGGMTSERSGSSMYLAGITNERSEGEVEKVYIMYIFDQLYAVHSELGFNSANKQTKRINEIPRRSIWCLRWARSRTSLQYR